MQVCGEVSKHFQLNKHPYDLTRVRNKLAFDLFRRYSIFLVCVPSLCKNITNFDKTALQYGNKDYGLFTHVEKWVRSI